MFETLTLIVVVWIALNLGFVLGAFFAALLIQAKRQDLSEAPLQITHAADGLVTPVSIGTPEPLSSTRASGQVKRTA